VRLRRGPLRVVLALGAVLYASGGAAAAVVDSASVTIDNLEPKLSKEDDGSTTAKLGFTNLTHGDITLTVAAVKPKSGCEPKLDEPTLKPESHADVKLTLPAGCRADKARVAFTVAAQPPATERFAVSGKAEDDKPTPDWRHLLVFPLAMLLAFGGLWWTYKAWDLPEPRAEEPPKPPVPEDDPPTPLEKPTWRGSLDHLPATYDFNESVVTNITALGAVLTGIFGTSSVVEAAFGEDAKGQLGLATLGAAAAVALIAAGAIIPLAVKARDAKSFTVIGILLGASVTLGGAIGELWVVTWTGVELDLGDLAGPLLIVTFVLAVALLIGYGHTALVATLNQGAVPPPAERSDALQAAQLIVAALRARDDINQDKVDAALADIDPLRYPGHATSRGDDPYPRRRAAMF